MRFTQTPRPWGFPLHPASDTWQIGVLTIVPEKADGEPIRNERMCQALAQALAETDYAVMTAWTRGRVEVLLDMDETYPLPREASPILGYETVMDYVLSPLVSIAPEHPWTATLDTDPREWDLVTSPVEAMARQILSGHQCRGLCGCEHRGNEHSRAWSESAARGVVLGSAMRGE